MDRAGGEGGVALILAMMALLFMSGLGLALVAATSSETLIAENFRASAEAAAAADAMAARTIAELRSAADWTPMLSGAARSTFVDGAPGGARTLADGTSIDLGAIVNLANCNKATTCRASDMDAVTAARPWGRNNPRWQLYAYGHLSRLLPGHAITSPSYVVAMVGDDPSETDSNPLRDAPNADDPGAGIVMLRIEAFGLQSAHRLLELTLMRSTGLRVLSWRP